MLGFSSQNQLRFYLNLLGGCLLATAAFAQTSVAPTSVGQSANSVSLTAVQAYQQQKLAVLQPLQALIAQGATPQQIQAWQQQHAAQLAALQQQAQALSAASAQEPMPIMTQVTIPDGATQEMEDFLVARAELANKFAQWHNQQIQNGSTNAAPTAAALAAFQKENAAEIQAQQQRAQVLAAQSAAQPLPVPPPLVIRAGTTPQLAAFLTLRDQLMREQITLHNRNVNATPAVQAAAEQQWHQQNAARFQQLQQLAQNLSSTSTP